MFRSTFGIMKPRLTFTKNAESSLYPRWVSHYSELEIVNLISHKYNIIYGFEIITLKYEPLLENNENVSLCVCVSICVAVLATKRLCNP